MTIAIIGASQMTKVFANKARSMGMRTICFAWLDNAVGVEDVDKFYDVSIFEVERITKICREECVSAVVPTTELTLAVAARVAEKLALPGNPVSVMENITRKNYVREKLVGIDGVFKQPKFWFIQNPVDLPDLQEKCFPVIVKPAAEGGKRGINVAYNRKELEIFVGVAFSADRFNHGIIVEEFLNGGDEYSVEMLSFMGRHQGIQITEKIISGPPHCVELGHSQPANIGRELRMRVFDGAKELLSLIGYQNGAAHIEIKIIDNTIYLIELNARTGGDYISYPLVQLSTGYDYIGEIISALIGKEPKSVDGEIKHFAGVRFITEQTAYLKPLFDVCDQYEWCYEKHFETDELQELKGNNCEHINYFIYSSDHIPDIVLNCQ